MPAVEVQHIDGEFHEEAVHGFAGRDPQPVARFEAFVLQQSSTALGTGIGDFGRIGQHDVASNIADVDFQTSGYNTACGIGLQACVFAGKNAYSTGSYRTTTFSVD